MIEEDPHDESLLYIVPLPPGPADPEAVKSLADYVETNWQGPIRDLLTVKLPTHDVHSLKWQVPIVNIEWGAVRDTRGYPPHFPSDDFKVASRILWRIYLAATASSVATSRSCAELAAGMLLAATADMDDMPQQYLQHKWGGGPIAHLCLPSSERPQNVFKAADKFFEDHPEPRTAESIAWWLTAICPEGPSLDTSYFSSAIIDAIKAQKGW